MTHTSKRQELEREIDQGLEATLPRSESYECKIYSIGYGIIVEPGSKDTKPIEKPNRTLNPSQGDTYGTLIGC